MISTGRYTVFSSNHWSIRSVFHTTFAGCHIVLVLGCLVVLGNAASASTRAASLAWAPPAPTVEPIIHKRFVGDADRDRIDDALTDRAQDGGAIGTFSAASGTSDAMLGVELIFSEPVAQEQIDTFLDLGGEITYMYRAVSYGWNGRIDSARLSDLPLAMGPTLVHVTGVPKFQWRMDIASQTGRVRPVWKPGFAGSVDGFDGDPNTTIAFVDTGIDGNHLDMAGRCIYWNNISGPADDRPTDFTGHGTAVAGVAVGTGESAGNTDTKLSFTYGSEFPTYACIADPITLPPGRYELSSAAFWDGWSASLDHIYWGKGSYPSNMHYVGHYSYGSPPRYLTNTIVSDGWSCYSGYVLSPYAIPLKDVTIMNMISDYPCVGDGFNTFSGVAPQCSWAAEIISGDVKVRELENDLAAGLDDLVAHRIDKNIKIINISAGLIDEEGLPVQSVPFRDKINSAVRNGVIVVVAAGNSADEASEAERVSADPERAALAISVGASNDNNALTSYSSCGFPDPQADEGEDFKPDLIAPGGSIYYSGIMSVDTGDKDGAGVDMYPNDYANSMGTSLSSPFVAGCAALVIEALERNGVEWSFDSDWYPRFVKMVLCATASETNAKRESNQMNPTLQRAAAGPDGFPAGKDRYEGYGLINADAAVEAISQSYVAGTVASDVLGAEPGDRRVWARTIDLIGGSKVSLFLANPTEGDFDLYLYSMNPSDTGTPIILASSTIDQLGAEESIQYTPEEDAAAFVVVKRVSGSGAFELTSVAAGPPMARDVAAVGWLNHPVAIALDAVDDGLPNPPGRLAYIIASLPEHGQLEQAADGTPITTAPTTLDVGLNGVVYTPDADWIGADSFTFYANDGGQQPAGGKSNTANVQIEILGEVTASYQVAASDDDAHAMRWGTLQVIDDPALALGSYMAGMRFRNVDIPQGAHIVSAVLKVKSCSSGLTVDLVMPIYAEAADDAAAFDSSHRVNNLTKTVASVVWDLSVANWEREMWYESPDLASVIQEVIDRPGWSADNALVVVSGTDNGASSSRKIRSYDGDPDGAAILEIMYKP